MARRSVLGLQPKPRPRQWPRVGFLWRVEGDPQHPGRGHRRRNKGAAMKHALCSRCKVAPRLVRPSTSHMTWCGACLKEYEQAYRQRPEVRQRTRVRNRVARQRPEYRQRERLSHTQWYDSRGGKQIVRKNTIAHRTRTGYQGFSSPEKKRARNITQGVIRRGGLFRQSCTRCGSTVAEAHHLDYEKPLQVIFLCRACHQLEHFPAMKAIRARGEGTE